MPRQLKLKTLELGDLELYLIYQYGEVWEDAWVAAQGLPIAELFTTVHFETMNHALRGWTSPLVKALGLSPAGALRKLPLKDRTCYKKTICPLYTKDCQPQSLKMPWCFEPGSVVDITARRLGAEAIRLWKLGVYLIVVTH